MERYYLICAYVLAGILGLCAGSFLNVVIYRLPRKMNIAFPPSHCTACDYTLKWYDNIPVVSYLLLGGKCRKCKQPISARYVAVELANTVLWLISVAVFWKESPVYAAVSAIACSILICVFCIDLEYMIIFNRFSVMLGLCGIIAVFFDTCTKPADRVIGALAGGGIFALIYLGGFLVFKKEALGLGDVKLAAAAGLLLGWQKLILAVLIGSLAGSIVLVALNRMKNRERDTEYPFGPFLAAGILIALLAGNPVLEWYTGIILG